MSQAAESYLDIDTEFLVVQLTKNRVEFRCDVSTLSTVYCNVWTGLRRLMPASSQAGGWCWSLLRSSQWSRRGAAQGSGDHWQWARARGVSALWANIWSRKVQTISGVKDFKYQIQTPLNIGREFVHFNGV